MPNSYKNSEVVHPFGYLKASTSLTCVNLFVMPYNYPVLLPLLDEFFKVHRLKVVPVWREHFQNYLRTMPAYYCQVMRSIEGEILIGKSIIKFMLNLPASEESSGENGRTQSHGTGTDPRDHG